MGSHALLCSCLPRAAMLGSRSKALLSSPLPRARVFLGAFVTLSAPSSLLPQSCLCWHKHTRLGLLQVRDGCKSFGSDCPGTAHVDRLHLCEKGRKLVQGFMSAPTWPKHRLVYELQHYGHHGGGRNGTVYKGGKSMGSGRQAASGSMGWMRRQWHQLPLALWTEPFGACTALATAAH